MTPQVQPLSQADAEAAMQRIVAFYETLSPQSLEQLAAVYEADAHFRDPFNAVQGLEAIRAIFQHMFDTLEQPRFAVTTCVVQGVNGFLVWEFRFGMRSVRRGEEQCIRGATHVMLSPAGRVAVHRDYWDAAEELYEKIPLLGGFMRWLRRRAAS